MSGQKHKAMDWLERGFVERHPLMLEVIEGGLVSATLHDEPRYEELLRRMNFPEDVIARILEDTLRSSHQETSSGAIDPGIGGRRARCPKLVTHRDKAYWGHAPQRLAPTI